MGFIKKLTDMLEVTINENNPIYKSNEECERDMGYFTENFNKYKLDKDLMIIGNLLINNCFTGLEALEFLNKYREIPASKYTTSMFYVELTTIEERKEKIIAQVEELKSSISF